ncbi:MAG TPA: alpha/beta fold hydrolase [Steroidobacteraceae bacterium]|nr:alpha/beta fold hydrolase [Steroidobacteraceae bacterium]
MKWIENAPGFRKRRECARALLIGLFAACYCLLAGCLFASTRSQQQRIADDYRRAQSDGGKRSVFAGLTVAGEIVSLDDARFSRKAAELGFWRPLDSVATTHPGIYFLAPFDAARVPVLFVHGMNGTPADFEYLVQHLDRSRFQAWVYSYPSGAKLEAIADHLDHTIRELHARWHFGPIAIVAHSMGGLVARGFILRHAHTAPADSMPLLVTISTPWEGHPAAERVPPMVNIWRDMVPGSVYLTSLFTAQLPPTTRYYLFFTFSDRTVTVASQLSAAAQEEAVRVIGFDDTHAGVLRDPQTAVLLNQLLSATFPGPQLQ